MTDQPANSTEPIELCAACGLCRCETHENCIRPTPPAGPTYLEHPMTENYAHLTDAGSYIEIKPGSSSITVCIEDDNASMAWVQAPVHLVPAFTDALAAADRALDADGIPFPGYTHDNGESGRLAVAAGPGLAVTVTATEEDGTSAAIAVSTYDVADLIKGIKAAAAS